MVSGRPRLILRGGLVELARQGSEGIRAKWESDSSRKAVYLFFFLFGLGCGWKRRTWVALPTREFGGWSRRSSIVTAGVETKTKTCTAGMAGRRGRREKKEVKRGTDGRVWKKRVPEGRRARYLIAQAPGSMGAVVEESCGFGWFGGWRWEPMDCGPG